MLDQYSVTDMAHMDSLIHSPLIQDFSIDVLNDPTVIKLEDHNEQSFQTLKQPSIIYPYPAFNNQPHRAHYEDGRLLSMYHPESYERTRLHGSGDYATQQSGSTCWPTSPIRSYKTPLSSSSPATAISLAPVFFQTTTSPCSSYCSGCVFPPSQLAASQATHSVPLLTQAASERQDSYLSLRTQSQTLLQTSEFKDCLAGRQTSNNMDQAVYTHPSWALTYPSAQQSVKAKPSGVRGRPSTVNPTELTFPMESLANDPEAFKVSAKLAFTRIDHENIRILVAAMNDITFSEDNAGMIKSWRKLRIRKAEKIASVCEDLLVCIQLLNMARRNFHTCC